MADSLVLKGVKDVKKLTGTDMLLKNPARGGNTHQIKQWWRNSVNTVYAACSVIKVNTSAGVVNLAIATGGREGAYIRIVHDGDFNFNFYDVKDIQRAALFTDQMQIIEHYMFPDIAGGSIVTVTPPGAGSRPSGGGEAVEAVVPEETIQDRAAAAHHTYAVTVDTYYNNNKYYLNGTRQDTITANPNETIYFDLSDASLSGHPLAIYSDVDKTTTLSVGVETSDDGTILLFTPPITGTFSYQCTQHNLMGGLINVVPASS